MANRHAHRPPSRHRQIITLPPKAFFLAAIRILSHPHPLLCGHSVSYQRYLCASIRQLSAFMRQLSASIRRPSESDPARYAARFGRSETASGRKRQIEHFKIPQKCTFCPKKGTFRPINSPPESFLSAPGLVKFPLSEGNLWELSGEGQVPLGNCFLFI
jgi:hypothetical protein